MSALPTSTFPRSRRPRKLVSYTPTTTAVPIYTCPVNVYCQVTLIVTTNISISTAKISLHHVRPTETVGTQNALYYQVDLITSTVMEDDGVKYLSPGDAIWVSCTAAATATITLYGIEE